MDSEREGEGGKIWENGIETCKISCLKRVASPGSMHDAGCWGWCTGTTQRDGTGREEGGGFRRKKKFFSVDSLCPYFILIFSSITAMCHVP